jgi:hypothetical protein
MIHLIAIDEISKVPQNTICKPTLLPGYAAQSKDSAQKGRYTIVVVICCVVFVVV